MINKSHRENLIKAECLSEDGKKMIHIIIKFILAIFKNFG